MATDYTLSVKTDLPLVRVANIAFDLLGGTDPHLEEVKPSLPPVRSTNTEFEALDGTDPHLEECDYGWQLFKFKVQYLDVVAYVNDLDDTPDMEGNRYLPWEEYEIDIEFDVPFRLDNEETRDIVVDAARKIAKEFPMLFSYNTEIPLCETTPDNPVVPYPTHPYVGPRALGDVEAMKFVQKELGIDPRKIR